MLDLPILAVDENPAVLRALRDLVEPEGIPLATAASRPEAEQIIARQPVGLLLLGLNEFAPPGGTLDLAFFDNLRAANIPIMLLPHWQPSGRGDPPGRPRPVALQLISGNTDLLSAIQGVRRRIQSRDGMASVLAMCRTNPGGSAQSGQLGAEPIIARSAILRDIMDRIDQIAQSDASILLTGENGTGKTQMAALIHRRSQRSEGKFVAVNMGAIPETLFESEMFGHIRGAFTDAKSDRIGRVELAHRGTFFMDEITNTSLGQQAKLLRLLDDKEFEKVGTSKTQGVDVRVIAATNANIHVLVRENQFRLDLLFRLNTIEIPLPPLRERKEDIPGLIEHFLRKFTAKYNKGEMSLGKSALEAVDAHRWPGNIRELAHVVERAVVLARSSVIDASDLILTGFGQPTASPERKAYPKPAANDEGPVTLEEIEDAVVRDRLKAFDNDVIKTADSLGISRSALYRRLQKNRDRAAGLN